MKKSFSLTSGMIRGVFTSTLGTDGDNKAAMALCNQIV